MRKIYIIGAVALMFAACTPSVHITTPATPGRADFSNYLAIGNSLTSGYTDNSLTVTGQLNSYPERLFEQFGLVPGVHGGKGTFVQPLLHSDNGFPSAKKVLAMTYNLCIPSDSSLAPIDFPNFVADPIDAQPFVSNVNNGQINNIGVPGIRIADYDVPGYAANFNPYAARFYHDPTTTPLAQLQYSVGNLYPTFFTMWLGANDVLGYATAGGVGKDAGTSIPTAYPNLYNPNDITPFNIFDSLYDQALTLAISTGASGALINIPDVTSIPFFTTVPVNGLMLTRQGQVDTLTALYAGSGFNNVFQIGANDFIIQDHNGATRQAVPGELILLTVPQDSITCKGWGSTTPIPNKYVLTTDEIQFIHTAVTNYNSYISFEATRHNLAYVDMNAYLHTIASGIAFDGIKYTSQFVTGGAFSLDGVHLTQRGYALVANQIIATINAKYGSTVPQIDANKFNGVSFPQ